MAAINREEQQYLDLIRDVMENGSLETGRNGDTISAFGRTMRFSLKDGQLPLLTTKHVAWKTCFRELMWFIRGMTDNQELQKQGVRIWNANATREFLDSRGLGNYPEGVLGPVYGYQWRHFNAPYIQGPDVPYWGNSTNQSEFMNRIETPPPHAGIDQLQQIINALKHPTERYSRRLIMTAWNPLQIDQMALPPCHVLAQFRVQRGNRLSCALYQRSGDIGLGVPFNIASYSFLTHLLARHCGLEAEEFVHFLGDAHIYTEHVEALKLQLEREPFAFPRIRISEKSRIEDYDLEDIVFTEEYRHHAKIEMEMIH
jgi:thymidylate synthase